MTTPDWVLDEANHCTLLADLYDHRVLAANLRDDVETLRHARRVRDAFDGAAASILASGEQG